MLRSVPFNDVRVGDEFSDIVTITNWHILNAAALFYDAGPNHVNPVQSAGNRFGGIIAPGFLTTGVMMGVAGRYFGWSIEAFLDTSIRFLGPVYPDDTIHILWRVTDTTAKEAFKGGIVSLDATAWQPEAQRTVVEMTAKLALNNSEAPKVEAPARSVAD